MCRNGTDVALLLSSVVMHNAEITTRARIVVYRMAQHKLCKGLHSLVASGHKVVHNSSVL